VTGFYWRSSAKTGVYEISSKQRRTYIRSNGNQKKIILQLTSPMSRLKFWAAAKHSASNYDHRRCNDYGKSFMIMMERSKEITVKGRVDCTFHLRRKIGLWWKSDTGRRSPVVWNRCESWKKLISLPCGVQKQGWKKNFQRSYSKRVGKLESPKKLALIRCIDLIDFCRILKLRLSQLFVPSDALEYYQTLYCH